MAMSSLVLVAASLWAWGWSTPPPPVRAHRSQRAASISPIIRRIVRRHMNDVNFCYEHALAANPTLTGRVVWKFKIAASGDVVASEVG